MDRLRSVLRNWKAAHRAMPSPWQLTKVALRAFKQDWRLFTGIVLVVLVPSTIVSTYIADPAADSSLAAYAALANSIMSAAVIWAVASRHERRHISVKQAYYQSSIMLVRLLVATFLIALMLLPLVLGLLIISFGLVEAGVTQTAGEKTLLLILAFLVAVPGIILVSRAVFSAFILADTELGPVQAIKASRQLTKKRLMPILARLLWLAIILLVILIIPIVVGVFVNNAGSLALWPVALMQILIGAFILPFANLYLYKFYRSLA